MKKETVQRWGEGKTETNVKEMVQQKKIKDVKIDINNVRIREE